MSSKYIDNLIGTVMAASEADKWDDARREWKVVSCEEDQDRERSCVCGHEHLRYLYRICNEVTGEEIYPIGSSCIEKFLYDEMDDDAKCWKQVYKLLHEVERLGKGQIISFDSNFFSRKMLLFLYEQGAFPDTEYNDDDGYNDYWFMLDMFNAQSWSERQSKKVYMIMKNSLYPWLRELWLQKSSRRKTEL